MTVSKKALIFSANMINKNILQLLATRISSFHRLNPDATKEEGFKYGLAWLYANGLSKSEIESISRIYFYKENRNSNFSFEESFATFSEEYSGEYFMANIM